MPKIVPLPADYAAWLTELKTRIHSAQQRATLAVNRELVLLYWQIGRDILERQDREGWGGEGDRTAGAGLAQRLPRHEGFFAAQPQIHARFCRGMAGPILCARGACTIALVPSVGLAGQIAWPRDAPLVRLQGHRAQLVAQHPGDADRNPSVGAQRSGSHQLFGFSAQAAVRPRPRIAERPLPFRFPRPERGGPGTRDRARAGQACDRVPAGAGRGLCLCRAAGVAHGGRRRVFHRPAFLPPETALLRRHRTQGRSTWASSAST